VTIRQITNDQLATSPNTNLHVSQKRDSVMYYTLSSIIVKNSISF